MAQLPSIVQDPSSDLTATFVPSAGMVCTSLSDGAWSCSVNVAGCRPT